MSSTFDADARTKARHFSSSPLGYELTPAQHALEVEKANSKAKCREIEGALCESIKVTNMFQQGLLTPADVASQQVDIWLRAAGRIAVV